MRLPVQSSTGRKPTPTMLAATIVVGANRKAKLISLQGCAFGRRRLGPALSV